MMVTVVPYRSPGTARRMRYQAMTSHGWRSLGYLAPRPVPGAARPRVLPAVQRNLSGCCSSCEADEECAGVAVSYEDARALSLGRLGASTALTEGVTGIKAGATAASLSTAIGTGAASAIGAGAAAGSIVPILGTAIGALVGLAASGVFSHRADPEVSNFNQAVQLYNTQGPQAVINIANKYLVLAGLFDLEPSQIKGNIPIYRRFGRLGEQAFVRALCATIQSAAATGQIVPTNTPQDVYNHIVLPWINSFGFGAMQDANGDMISMVILGMTAEYLAGQQGRWFAVGGDYPFANLPPFALPASAAALPAPAAGASSGAPASAPPSGPARTNVLVSGSNQTLATSLGVFWARPDGSYYLNNAPSGLLGPPQVPQGTISIHTAAGGVPIAVNGDASQYQVNGPGSVTLLPAAATPPGPQCSSGLQWNGTQCVPPNSAPTLVPPSQNCAAGYLWNGAQCVLPAGAAPTVPTAAGPIPAAVPAGFTQVAADQNGVPIFANPQGVLYQWTGTSMQLFAGQLGSGSSVAAQVQAAIQNALASGQQQQQAAAAGLNQAQAAGVSVTPQLQQQVAAQTEATAAAPVQAQTAGLGLTGAAGWLAVGSTVLLLMFATARPVKGRRHG